MATSKREPPPPNPRAIRMTPTPKPAEPGQGPRRARSVPSSPDRKFSSPPTSGSPDVYRSSLSLNARPVSSRSMFSSASSSILGKAQHSPSSAATAKPMRGKADKSTATTRPPALVTPSASLKDTTRVATKSTSTLQKSKLSPRTIAEKKPLSSSSPKPSTQKAMPGVLGGGRTQASVSSARAKAAAKRRTGAANGGASIQRARSVSARAPLETPIIKKDQEEELSLEFDEMESISTPSIEEHLRERLPDPVELKPVIDVASYAPLQADHDKPSSEQEGDKNGEVEEKPSSEQQEDNNGELKELVSEEKHDIAVEEQNGEENVVDVGIKNEADAVVNNPVNEPELIEKEVALPKAEPVEKEKPKGKVEKPMMPVAAKRSVVVQGWRKDEPTRSNDMIEETKSKLLEERKSKVMALVGAFETASMSFKKKDGDDAN